MIGIDVISKMQRAINTSMQRMSQRIKVATCNRDKLLATKI